MVTQISPSAASVARTVGFKRPALQYELNVVASSVADVVSGLGGWLFDCRMAGWNVGVALSDRSDDRALRILGVKTLDPEVVWRAPDPERLALKAIAADRFEADELVHGHGLRALRENAGQVAFWGPHCPGRIAESFHPAQYRLSSAARAFKSHALVAAGVPVERVTLAETVFRTAGGMLDTGLVPVC